MRLYSTTRAFFQWYLGFSVFFIFPFLYILSSYAETLANALQNYSIKIPIFEFGVSLFSIVFLCTVICHVLAESRGVRCSRR